MAASRVIPVRNTFVHIPIKSLDCDSPGPVRKVRSDPLPFRWCCREAPAAAAEGEEERASPRRPPAAARGGDASPDCWSPVTARSSSGSTASLDSTPSFDGLDDCFQTGPGSTSTSLAVSRQQSMLSITGTSASASASDAGAHGGLLAAQAPQAALLGLAQQSALRRVPTVMPMVLLMPVPAQPANHMPAVVQPPTAPSARATSICWRVGSELTSTEANKVESEPFDVVVPGLPGSCQFQVILYAVGNQGRRGARGFARSCGQGRVELRCLTELPAGSGKFLVTATVGAGDRAQPPRPPVPHDFSERHCCTWRKWDFRSAADSSTHQLTVWINLMPPIGAHI